ncbi:Asp-tRNA(Asn)/Glu-tRNA(Gln) amidotransferase subunit GatB [Candidatus Berkelbacteria bacterium]|nr:Asp-tRNA(Asn)/Glu-tRNA(Gln) amidotransferase subunit GatB [Candidatus Berkelbacteria bacterium]
MTDPRYQATIGLEIHAELKTKTKMFCGCRNFSENREQKTDDGPNTLVCPVCLGLPGALPVPNRQAVDMTLLIAKTLGCKVADASKWDRKNYFYPDLPKGYQISQYDMPLASRGWLEFKIQNSKFKIQITRIHLEEDTGKLTHPAGADYSLIDFNRSGVPLVELVTEPVMHSAQEAKAFAQEYQLILRYLDVSNADMERGQMRVEANISVAPNAKFKSKNAKLGTKVEVKNLNSFRSVERAIDYEVKRQIEVLESGGTLVQETRGFSDAKSVTFSQRSKETASDYRYFPEPDIPSVTGLVHASGHMPLPKLPDAYREELQTHGLKDQYVETLIRDRALLKKFEDLIEMSPEIGGAIANLLVNKPELRTKSNQEMLAIARLPDHTLKRYLKGERLENLQGEAVDTEAMVRAVEEVVNNNPDAVADFQSGKRAVLGYLIGQVMRKLQGADPKMVTQELLKQIDKQ